MSCRKHDRELSAFCVTDQTVVCAQCAAMEHGGHTLGLVSEERRKEQENLRNMLMRSKEIQQKQKQRCRAKRRVVEQIQEEAQEAEDYCQGVLVGVIGSLQRQYRSVRSMIRAREEAALADVDASVQRLQRSLEKMKSLERQLDLLEKTESDVDFLQKWSGLQGPPEMDQEFLRDEDDLSLLFAPIKRTVDLFCSQLEELCAKGFEPMTLEATVPTADEEEQSDVEEDEQQMDTEDSSDLEVFSEWAEPVTRADFLRYACRLTFDSATAHHDLQVSMDEREVKFRLQSVKAPSIRNPHRFLYWRQLLCREPLLQCWSYYEVEVEGDKVEVALAYSSMDRRSRSNLSAFGGNAQSWSLDRSAFYSVSHRDRGTRLNSAPCHPRIGVFVKPSEGEVSFYEVAESMIFLFKVEAEFTEPLLPGFWLGEKCRISICDLR